MARAYRQRGGRGRSLNLKGRNGAGPWEQPTPEHVSDDASWWPMITKDTAPVTIYRADGTVKEMVSAKVFDQRRRTRAKQKWPLAFPRRSHAVILSWGPRQGRQDMI